MVNISCELWEGVYSCQQLGWVHGQWTGNTAVLSFLFSPPHSSIPFGLLLLGYSISPLALCDVQSISRKPKGTVCNGRVPSPAILTSVGLPDCSTESMVILLVLIFKFVIFREAISQAIFVHWSMAWRNLILVMISFCADNHLSFILFVNPHSTLHSSHLSFKLTLYSYVNETDIGKWLPTWPSQHWGTPQSSLSLLYMYRFGYGLRNHFITDLGIML